MTRRLEVGLSTCPNDTFAFHALMSGDVRVEGDVELAFTLADVEELNRRVLAGELDVAKTSFHAALYAAGDVCVLPAGSALGRGVGPLLLAARPGERPASAARVLCPGKYTTATLLWELFHRGQGAVEQCVFSDIMPALAEGRADFGVCIHEGRFTWRSQGLSLVEDLGETWESATGAPLPLGGIVARRALGEDVARAVTRAIRASIEWARAHPDAALATMRRNAQELDDGTLWAHVELYVNDHTLDLGSEGRRALDLLASRARERGLLGIGTRLEVLADA